MADMKPADIERGDVFTYGGGRYVVRDKQIDKTTCRLRLAAGRTDEGFWFNVDPNVAYPVYRPDIKIPYRVKGGITEI